MCLFVCLYQILVVLEQLLPAHWGKIVNIHTTRALLHHMVLQVVVPAHTVTQMDQLIFGHGPCEVHLCGRTAWYVVKDPGISPSTCGTALRPSRTCSTVPLRVEVSVLTIPLSAWCRSGVVAFLHRYRTASFLLHYSQSTYTPTHT